MGKSTANGLDKGYTATAAIGNRRIVQFGAADGTVILSTGPAVKSIGLTTDIDAAAGERCDVFLSSVIGEVVLGGTVARGASITSDGAGAGVAAATGNWAIGQAEQSGVVGDIISVIINPHTA